MEPDLFWILDTLVHATPEERKRLFEFTYFNHAVSLQYLTELHYLSQSQDEIAVFSIEPEGLLAYRQTKTFYQSLLAITVRKKSVLSKLPKNPQPPEETHGEALLLALADREDLVPLDQIEKSYFDLTAMGNQEVLNSLRAKRLLYVDENRRTVFTTAKGELSLANLTAFYLDPDSH